MALKIVFLLISLISTSDLSANESLVVKQPTYIGGRQLLTKTELDQELARIQQETSRKPYVVVLNELFVSYNIQTGELWYEPVNSDDDDIRWAGPHGSYNLLGSTFLKGSDLCKNGTNLRHKSFNPHPLEMPEIPEGLTRAQRQSHVSKWLVSQYEKPEYSVYCHPKLSTNCFIQKNRFYYEARIYRSPRHFDDDENSPLRTVLVKIEDCDLKEADTI